MSDFNKDDYLNDLPDADELANGQASLMPMAPMRHRTPASS